MKLRNAIIEEIQIAMDMIDSAREHLKIQGINQWQNGYPDEDCVREV